MLSLTAPYPFFSDIDGDPLDGGYIFVGEVAQNPETAPVVAYWDEALTQPAAQPLRTSNGYIVRNGTPARVYVDGDDFSMTCKRANGVVIFYEQSVAAASGLRDDLTDTTLAAKGAGMVGFSNTPNYVASTLGDVVKSLAVHVRAAPYYAGSPGVDNAAAISQAIADAFASGRGHVYVQGQLTCTGPITAAKHVTVLGDGKRSTILTFTHTGDGFQSTWPINASNAVHFYVKDLGIKCTNLANTGGGFVDVGGSYIGLEGCGITGFKYGIIFDQTEIAYIEKNNIEAQFSGGAGVWLVDGPQHTPGANPGFTNRITITGNQINQDADVWGVADDGGYAHEIEGNNFNGCLSHMRIGGVNGLSIDDNECESATGPSITFENTSIAGGPSIGASLHVKFDSNIIVPTAGQSCIVFNASTSPVVMVNNFLGNSVAAKITGLNNVNTFIDLGNSVSGGPYISGTPTKRFSSADSGTFTPVIAIGGATTGITYTQQVGSFTRVGNAVHYSVDITLSSKGALTGAVRVNGLPYAAAAGMTQMQPAPFATGIVTATSVGAFITTGDTGIQLQNANVNFSAALNDTNISNTTTIRLNGSYISA